MTSLTTAVQLGTRQITDMTILLFYFFVVMSICLDHERSSVMVTPKYFAARTLSSSTLCRMYLVLRGFAFFII